MTEFGGGDGRGDRDAGLLELNGQQQGATGFGWADDVFDLAEGGAAVETFEDQAIGGGNGGGRIVFEDAGVLDEVIGISQDFSDSRNEVGVENPRLQWPDFLAV